MIVPYSRFCERRTERHRLATEQRSLEERREAGVQTIAIVQAPADVPSHDFEHLDHGVPTEKRFT